MISSQELFSLAESCKIEENRINFPSEKISHLNETIFELSKQHGNYIEQKVQVCRIIGNLCYDNDENRERICSAGIIPPLLSLFRTENNPDVLKMLWSAVFNLSMDNEIVQTEMLKNGMESYIERDMLKLGCLPLQVLGNMLESELGTQQFFDSVLPSALAHVLKSFNVGDSSGIDVMEAASIVIETIVERQHEVLLARSVIFDALLVYLTVDHRLESVDYFETKELILKQLSLITSNDELLNELVTNDKLVNNLLSFMTMTNSSYRETTINDFLTTGAICIGNLARSDENCDLLVSKYGVEKYLLPLVKMESLKVAHAALGALKNLSLCRSCRGLLGRAGTIEAVISLCSREQASALHMHMIGIIKNLVTDNSENCEKVLSSINGKRSPLDKMVKLVWKDSKENDGGVRNEGGRLIVALIKYIHESATYHHIPKLFELGAITLVVQSLTGAFLTNQETEFGSCENVFDHHVHFDAQPKTSKVFPLVQNQSLVALGLLVNMEPKTAAVLLRYSVSVFPTILDILNEGHEGENEYSMEIKANALILLKVLILNDGMIN